MKSHRQATDISQTGADTVIFWCSSQDISLFFAFTLALEPHFAGQAEENT